MHLQTIDWTIIVLFFVVSLAIGMAVARRAGKSSTEFFAAGKSMPWWLLGVSMVATTFSTDTPLLVTEIVRKDGVAGNWVWWAFLLTGMMTVFVYARLWQRAGILTDIEFYELRYSGKSAAFLRGFRAIYLGVIFNVLILASVSLAATKIGSVLLGLTPWHTILIAGTITVIYSSMGGLRGVLITDFVQFGLAMIGSFGAAYYALRHPDVGGLSGLLSNEVVIDNLGMLPDFSNKDALMAIFIIPLAVQWWATWYPGAEPGGGAFIAQRMLAARDENNSVGAVFLFNAAHYALRPWPWMIVALCSLIVYPDVASLKAAFPGSETVADDTAYPAMLTLLPAGLMGLMLASLIAAYMSTLSTLLNLGSSYVVHDFYRRFIAPDSTEKQIVRAGRICTVGMMVLAGALTFYLESAKTNFDIILQVGAGTGLLFILRWFWMRINAWSEISAMLISFAIAFYFATAGTSLKGWQQLTLSVGITTIGWIVVTYLTPATDAIHLQRFRDRIWPRGIEGGRGIVQGLLCMFLGCVAVYSALFATGYWIYGQMIPAIGLTLAAIISTVMLFNAWKRIAS